MVMSTTTTEANLSAISESLVELNMMLGCIAVRRDQMLVDLKKMTVPLAPTTTTTPTSVPVRVLGQHTAKSSSPTLFSANQVVGAGVPSVDAVLASTMPTSQYDTNMAAEVLTHIGGLSLFQELCVDVSDAMVELLPGYVVWDYEIADQVLTHVGSSSLFIEIDMDTHNELEGKIDKPTTWEARAKKKYRLMAIGGSLTATPGVLDMIDDSVHSIVNDMLQWTHMFVVPLDVNVDTSELELKREGKLVVTVIQATSLKDKESTSKSDLYVILYVRPMLKLKIKVIDNNLSREWNETFELLVKYKETQSFTFEGYDEDNLQQDKRLGVPKLAVNNIQPETPIEITLNLMQPLDSLKIKDYREERLQALENKAVDKRKRVNDATVIGSTMVALGGATSLVFPCQRLNSALNVGLAKALEDASEKLVLSFSCTCIGARPLILSNSSLKANAEWGYAFFFCKLRYAESKIQFLVWLSKYELMPWDPGDKQNKVLCASSTQPIGAPDLQTPWDPGIVTIHSATLLYLSRLNYKLELDAVEPARHCFGASNVFWGRYCHARYLWRYKSGRHGAWAGDHGPEVSVDGNKRRSCTGRRASNQCLDIGT
ncbi:hypothetical protein QYE76_035748 [Lolium multiflorum]|uniref:C2 domain-containing protein n=1 Tax=Lolium multiflorum TaxID=4521 RepID=A0AAD8QZP2_LOLMU|nr:hypothetical protein QYE76_035748 [Lolium multiflorum]